MRRGAILRAAVAATLCGAALAGLPAAPAILSGAARERQARAPVAAGPAPLVPNGVRHFLASALSGAAGVTALAPLEVVRISLMVSKDSSLAGTVASLRKSGGWFRGNSADTLATALKVGITMPAFAVYKRALTSAAVRWGGLPAEAPPPRWAIFVAGALAGCTATCLTFPLDVVRTRIALECPVDGNVLTCLLGISDEEGVRALYRGLSATVAGILPFSSVKLATYDTLRNRATGGSDAASLPLAQSARFGAAAGIVAATTCFPFEVVRRRQMVGEYATLSVLAAMGSIARDEGLGALFKGVSLNIVKVGLANALGFVFYEEFKDVFAVDGRTPPWRRRKEKPPAS